MKKKLLGIFTALLFSVVLVACNNDEGNDEESYGDVNPVIVDWIDNNPQVAIGMEEGVANVDQVTMIAGIGNEIIVVLYVDEETTEFLDDAPDDVDVSELFSDTLEASADAYVETANIAQAGLQLDYLRLTVAFVDANGFELARDSFYAD